VDILSWREGDFACRSGRRLCDDHCRALGRKGAVVAFRGELGQILNRTSHEMHVSRPDSLPLRSGMSWSKAGSHALTALNAVVLNGGVQQWVRQREIAFEFAVKAA
jgi:hypothetical protein